MQTFFYENSLPLFILLTVCLGGWAAWMTGRACALGWHGVSRALVFMLPLTAVLRFVHYIPPFNGRLFSLHYYMVDLTYLLLVAFFAFFFTRARQMVRQYGWLYERSSPFSWRRKKP